MHQFRQHTRLLFLLLAVACLLSVAPTLYSAHIGSSNSFNTTSQYVVGSNQVDAASFTPSANFSLTEIDLPLRSISPPSTTSVIVKLLSDASGKPGTTVLESWTITSIAYNGPPSTPTIFSLASVVDPALSSGVQYWVAVYQNSTVSGGWSLSSNSSFLQTGYDKSLNSGSTWTFQNPCAHARVQRVRNPYRNRA